MFVFVNFVSWFNVQVKDFSVMSGQNHRFLNWVVNISFSRTKLVIFGVEMHEYLIHPEAQRLIISHHMP